MRRAKVWRGTIVVGLVASLLGCGGPDGPAPETEPAARALVTAGPGHPGRVLWTGLTQTRAVGPAAVAVDGGRVFTVAATVSSSVVLRAFDGTTGALLWSQTVFGVSQALVAAAQGLVYVVGATFQGPELAAFAAATGAPAWTRTFGASADRIRALAASGGTIALAGQAGGAFFVAVYDSGGTRSWAYTATGASSANAVVISGGRVMAGGSPGFVVRSFAAVGGGTPWEATTTPTAAAVNDLAADAQRVYAVGGSPGAAGITRALDVATGSQAWQQALPQVGSGQGVAVLGTTVFTTGSQNATPSGGSVLFVEARTTKAGALRWSTLYDPGLPKGATGIDVTAIGQRVYVLGNVSDANTRNFVLRAYGAADGYPHWTQTGEGAFGLGATDGFASSIVATASTVVIGASGIIPAANEGQAYARAYEVTAIGGAGAAFNSCNPNSGFTMNEIPVATLPGQAFAACQQFPTTSSPVTAPSTVFGFDIQTGDDLWRDAFRAPTTNGGVRVRDVAAASGLLVAAGLTSQTSTDGRTVVRAYRAGGFAGSPQVAWTDTWAGALRNDVLPEVAAAPGIAVVAGQQGGTLLVKAYKLDVASTAACWTTFTAPCVPWSVSLPGIPEATAGVDIHGASVAVAISRADGTMPVFVLNLATGASVRYTTSPPNDTTSGLPYDVALGDAGVYTAGTGDPDHTYYAGGYALGTTNALNWIDNARPPGSSVIGGDARGVAVVESFVYGCGYGFAAGPIKTATVRKYNAIKPVTVPLTPIWEAVSRHPSLWAGAGQCMDIFADAQRAFVTIETPVTSPNNDLAIASIDVATGRDDWIALAPAPTTGPHLTREGDRLLVGRKFGAKSGVLQVYEAVCSVHGTVSSCP